MVNVVFMSQMVVLSGVIIVIVIILLLLFLCIGELDYLVNLECRIFMYGCMYEFIYRFCQKEKKNMWYLYFVVGIFYGFSVSGCLFDLEVV